MAVSNAIARVQKWPTTLFERRTDDPSDDTPEGTTATNKGPTELADSDQGIFIATPVETTRATEFQKLLGVDRGPGAPPGLTDDQGAVSSKDIELETKGYANYGYDDDTVVRTIVITAEVVEAT